MQRFALVLITVLGLIAVAPAPASHAAPYLYCADFASQADAQAFYRQWGADAAHLDADQDGIACEWNNGPYDYSVVSITAPQPQNDSASASVTSTGPVQGSGGVCPAAYPIKANANSNIYHVPGQRFYDVTNANNCYADASSAAAAGYRASKV